MNVAGVFLIGTTNAACTTRRLSIVLAYLGACIKAVMRCFGGGGPSALYKRNSKSALQVSGLFFVSPHLELELLVCPNAPLISANKIFR